MKLVILLLSILLCNFLFAQEETFNLKVKIIGQDNVALSGNLLALSARDSSIIKGTYFIESDAELAGLSQNEFLVKITSLGYQDTIFKASNSQKEEVLDLGTIQLLLHENNLNTVSVIGKLPLFEPTPEGAVKVNVQNTMLASSATLLDVLAKSPNVLVSGGSVSVFGKGEALLYLDGNPVTIDQLNGIPVSQVKNIEIISNPSARYDANGKAVINIHTINYHKEGWQGTVYHNSILAKSYLGGTNINLNYRKKKWSISTGYGIFLGRDWDQLEAERTLTSDAGIFVSDNFHLNENKITNFSTYNLGIDYKIDSTKKVAIEYRGFYDIMDLNQAVVNKITFPTGENNTLQTQNAGRNKRFNNSLVLNYRSDLDTLGSNLFYAAQYSVFSGNLNDQITEDYFVEDVLSYTSNRDSRGLTAISIFTTQLDYVKKFKNTSYLETGAKYAYAQNTGQIDFYSKLSNEVDFELLTGLSNNFEYKEAVPAAYLQYFGSINSKITYKIGARTEYTIANGYSKVTDQQIIDTSYLNLFPNTSIIAKITEIFSIGLAYSSRIDRPKYQELDPFIQYQDSLTSFQGNPFLVPEKTQAFELNFNIQGFNFLKLGYNSSSNSFRNLIEQGTTGPNSVVLRTINVQHLDSYFATLSIPVDLKGYSSYTTASLSFDKITDDRPIFTTTGITPRLYLYSYNKFNVKQWFNIELFGAYIGKQNDGIYFTEPTYSISCGVSKSFLKNKLSVRLLANDIFRTNREAGNFEIGATKVVYDTRLNTHYYQISLTYNFGRLKEKVTNTKDPGEKEKERIQ
ncbi:MAG: outer membrane beta-barrel protein [Crocinitomix sp.]|nr:outer membrane beta-barrel protein [Crocinitomix sp.]